MLSRNSFKNGNLKTAHGGNHSFKICFIYDSVGFFLSGFVCMYMAFVIVIYFSILFSLFGWHRLAYIIHNSV